MPALSRWFGLIGGLAVVFCATAGPGYLPIVGPAPLRFATPPPPPATPVTLPPLAFLEVRPAPVTNETPAAASQAALAPAVPGPVSTESADEQSIVVSPLGPLDPIPADTHSPSTPGDSEVIAPQMLLRYFARPAGTNSAGVSLFAPVGFVPPQPLAPPSSSATFQTTPPAKP